MKRIMRTILPRTCWFEPLLLVALFGLSLPTAWAAEDGKPPVDAAMPDPELREWGTLEQKATEGQLAPKEEERRRWLGGRLMDRILQASLASFVLEGEVVDEGGTRLNEVSLRISKEKERGVDNWVYDKEDQLVNGTFSIKVRGYSVVRLYFSKEGYYPENTVFSCDDEDDPLSPGYKPDRAVDRRDIRVVLEKMGDITHLIEANFKLTYRRQQDSGASGYVATFDRDKWLLRSKGAGSLYPIPATNLLDPEQIPPMCVYVIPKVDGDGRIINEDKAGPDWHRSFLLPQEMRLITSDPEGGFIVYDQKEGEQAYWSMKLAPESGYKQEVALDADWLFRHSSYVRDMSNAGTYFYFKIDGRYGKGRIDSPSFPEGDYALEVGTTFQLQTDGSRNLDTGRR